LIASLEGVLSDPAKLAKKENPESAVKGVKGLLKPAEAGHNVPKEIGAFRKAFDELLKKAGIDQLVVLIDGLDRCLPDTAIETLEAIRLFVFTARTALVVAAVVDLEKVPLIAINASLFSIGFQGKVCRWRSWQRLSAQRFQRRKPSGLRLSAERR